MSMSTNLEFISEFIQNTPLDRIRPKKNLYATKIQQLWNEKVMNTSWTAEHPEISLKVIALLDQHMQKESTTIQLLSIIARKHLNNEKCSAILKDVLEDAVTQDNWELIMQLISLGISPDQELFNGSTLLHLAVKYSKINEIENLLIAKANPDCLGVDKETPLHLAAEIGQTDIAITLHHFSADINAVDKDRNTALHKALQNNHEIFAHTLLDLGADPDIQDKYGDPPLYEIISKGSDDLAFKVIDYMHNLNISDRLKQTCLHIACHYKREKIALKLIEKGVWLNPIDTYGNTPLHYACEKKLVITIEKLLEKGASPDIQNNQHFFPFYFALRDGNEKIIDLFKTYLESLHWEKNLFYQGLFLKEYEKTEALFQKWRKTGIHQKILANILHEKNVAKLLLESHREWLETFIEAHDVSDLDHSLKLALLPLLSPEEIEATIDNWDIEEHKHWLEINIELEKTPSGEILTDTVYSGLQTIYTQWIQFILWEDESPNNFSAQLMNDTSRVFNKLPHLSFAAAMCCDELRPIIIQCFTLLPHDQIAMLTPTLNSNEFFTLAEKLLIENQRYLVRASTNRQKIFFLKRIPIKHDKPIHQWLTHGYHKLYKELENIIDKKILTGEQNQTQIAALLENLEKATILLPSAIARDSIKLHNLLSSFKKNHQTEALTQLLEQHLVSKINQCENASTQLRYLRKSIYEDSILKLFLKKANIPFDFLCGIMQTMMTNPVTAHGHTFEYSAIQQWLEEHSNCPLCRTQVILDDFAPNEALKTQIEESNLASQ